MQVVNCMYVSSVNNNNINFERKRLKIRIKGSEFEKHPESKKLLHDDINHNYWISEFFSKHRGKITVTSESIPMEVMNEYPRFLRRVQSTPYALPFDKFKSTKHIPVIKIICSYSRAFALRNLFKKPVRIEMKTPDNNNEMTWDKAIEYAQYYIKMLGHDTEENALRHGDNVLRDLEHIEGRRLQKEKP